MERDGVRVSIEVDRNPLPAGEPTWVSATVTNIGKDDLIWFHDGCAIAVGVGGSLEDAKWRTGRAQISNAAEFKELALEAAEPEDGSISISFLPERFAGKGSFGCADIGISETIRPGRSIKERSVWTGFGGQTLGPPPTGAVKLVGSFRYYWRERTGEPEDVISQVIDVSLPAWVVGTGESIIHPGEAVDAALLEPRLHDVLATRKLRSGHDAIIRFDPAAVAWQVGVLDYGDLPEVPPRIHMVGVDARSGALREWIERVWDFDVDGFP